MAVCGWTWPKNLKKSVCRMYPLHSVHTPVTGTLNARDFMRANCAEKENTWPGEVEFESNYCKGRNKLILSIRIEFSSQMYQNNDVPYELFDRNFFVFQLSNVAEVVINLPSSFADYAVLLSNMSLHELVLSFQTIICHTILGQVQRIQSVTSKVNDCWCYMQNSETDERRVSHCFGTKNEK